MAFDVKSNGLDALESKMKAWRGYSKRGLREDLEHRTSRFGFSLFAVNKTQGKRTRKKILKLDSEKILPRHGTKTQKQEKARRVFAAGYVATGWLVAALKFQKFGKRVKSDKKIDRLQGSVDIKVTSWKGTATLINSTPGAKEADDRHNLTAKAVKREVKDIQKYLDRKSEERARRAGFRITG